MIASSASHASSNVSLDPEVCSSHFGVRGSGVDANAPRFRSMLMIHKSSTFASNTSPAGSLGAALPCTAPDLARRVP